MNNLGLGYDKAVLLALENELESANQKWRLYEQEYILPCFDLAKESGIDLQQLVKDNAGTNCVILLIKNLQAKIADLERKLS